MHRRPAGHVIGINGLAGKKGKNQDSYSVRLMTGTIWGGGGYTLYIIIMCHDGAAGSGLLRGSALQCSSTGLSASSLQ